MTSKSSRHNITATSISLLDCLLWVKPAAILWRHSSNIMGRPMWRGTSLPTPTCQQHQRTSREQHPWVTDFRQQSHRQHLATASWEGWPRPANQETPKCLAHRKRKITNCSLCPKKSTKLWCCLLHTKRVTNTPKVDWVGVIFVPFYWTIYLQLTDISERLVRLDIVNALRRLWLSQL